MWKKWNDLPLSVRIGIIILLVCISPLVILLGLNELGMRKAGNTLVPEILAMLTYYPSILLLLIGSVLTIKRSRKAKALM